MLPFLTCILNPQRVGQDFPHSIPAINTYHEGVSDHWYQPLSSFKIYHAFLATKKTPKVTISLLQQNGDTAVRMHEI